MTPAEFDRMRLAHLLEAMTVYQEEKMADRRHLGELARGAALRLFNVQLKVKDRIKDPADFWPMPWDEERKETDIVKAVRSWTQEERDRKAREFLERIGEYGG